MMRHIVASPDKARLLHFDGGFRLVKDAAKEHNARAAINAGFFSMSKRHPVDSYPVGLVAVDGQVLVWPNNETTHFDTVYSKDSEVVIGGPLPVSCDWAITAGPRLLDAGRVCEQSINDSRWAAGGIQPTNSSVPRVAIGVKSSGDVVLAYWAGATIRQMATDLLTLGCVDALAGDGGGSASWYDNANPEQTVSQRLIPNCFVVEGGVTLPSIPEPTNPKAKRFYISPSQQPENLGVGDYGTEQRRMFELGWMVASYLSRLGHRVLISRPGMKIREDIIPESDTWGADYHVALHSNAFEGKGKGVVGLHWPGSVYGEKAIRAVCEVLSVLNPNGFGRVSAESDLAEISGPSAYSVYIEVGFHDRVDEAAWIVQEMDLIARAIAGALSAI